MPVLPRHVLCVLGNWKNLDPVETLIAQVAGEGYHLDREYSLLTPDARMPAAFEASYDRVRPTMSDSDWQAVAHHSAVAYILSPPMPKEQAVAISGKMLILIEALFNDGAIAVKAESAGIAHGRERWQRLAKEYRAAVDQGDEHAACSKLFFTWVRRPLEDEDLYHTCGMHLLGERDIEIETSLELSTALKWIDLLGLYLAADRPTRPILDGAGFRLENPGPRRLMRLHDCERYASDDFFFNPYGYIRLEEAKA